MKLRIVSVNDVYSLENLPRLASLVAHARTVDPPDRLLVTMAGDFLSPSILSSLDAGRGMVDCMNGVGFTHVTFGNHEDDIEPAELRARIAELHATWLATNVRGIAPALPATEVIEVAGVHVGLLGVVMTDPSVYRRAPFGGEGVVPPIPAALAEAKRLREEGCDLVIPLTHQFIADDRALARAQRATGAPFPVIVGGHEHESFREDEGGTWIVKAGIDAGKAVVVDVTRDGSGAFVATTRLEAVAAWPEDAEVRARVDRHMTRVRELESATLLRLAHGETLSSVGTRRSQTTLGAVLCDRIRDCSGADLCLFNGGGIRASRTYAERFTYGDLKAEVPFDNEIVVAKLPGAVVRDAVAASRARAPAEHGGFLQVDSGVVVEGLTVTAVRGAPLEPERPYRVALVRNMFFGLDHNEPLEAFARAHPESVPDAGSGRDVRIVLVDAFSVDLWKQLGGFDAVDTDGDEKVTASDVAAALARITLRPSRVAADLVVHALDANGDKIITREEAAAAEKARGDGG